MDYDGFSWFFRFCDSGAPKSSSWHQPHRELHWKILYHWLCIGPPKLLKLNLEDTTWHNQWVVKGMKQVKQVHPISSITWSPWQLKGSNSARDGHQNIGWSHEPMLGHCWIPNGIPNVLRLKSRFRNLHFLNYHWWLNRLQEYNRVQFPATTICVPWRFFWRVPCHIAFF